MPNSSSRFATGRYALAQCDICGVRTPYIDLRMPTIRGRRTGLLVCPRDYDPDHPQNFLSRYITVDPQALRHARPDTGKEASRVLHPPGNWINGQPPPPGRQFKT